MKSIWSHVYILIGFFIFIFLREISFLFLEFCPTVCSIRHKTKEFYTFFVYLLLVIAMEEKQNTSIDSSSGKPTLSGLNADCIHGL